MFTIPFLGLFVALLDKTAWRDDNKQDWGELTCSKWPQAEDLRLALYNFVLERENLEYI